MALLSAAAVAGAAGCNDPAPAPSVRVDLGTPASRVQFAPLSALAEYVELPGGPTELTVTLATYEASCGEYTRPNEGETRLTVVVLSPAGQPMLPGSYPWAGHEAHGGTPDQPERAYSLPSLRRGRRSFGVPPGGELVLRSLGFGAEHGVAGLLDFEFPGDASTSSSQVRGAFRAQLCRATRPDETG